MRSVLCHCLNEVLVPDDHEGAALCEHCDSTAMRRLRERLEAARARETERIQTREAEFHDRLARIGGEALRRIRPGETFTARCSGCHRPYVYDAQLHLQHAGGVCPGGQPPTPKVLPVATVTAPVRRARHWYDDDHDDDELEAA